MKTFCYKKKFFGFESLDVTSCNLEIGIHVFSPHTLTIIHRWKNNIEYLKNDQDRWIHDSGELESMAFNYFTSLHTKEENSFLDCPLSNRFLDLDSKYLELIWKHFEDFEIKQVVFSMGGLKAHRPDGLYTLFFHCQ